MNLLKKINLIENQRPQFNYLFSLFSTRPLQVKHFLKFTGKKRKLFTQFKILNSLLFTQFISQI